MIPSIVQRFLAPPPPVRVVNLVTVSLARTEELSRCFTCFQAQLPFLRRLRCHLRWVVADVTPDCPPILAFQNPTGNSSILRVPADLLPPGHHRHPHLWINAIVEFLNTVDPRSHQFFLQWDDDDYHLPIKVATLLKLYDTPEHNPYRGTTANCYYHVSGNKHMTAFKVERPHPNTALFPLSQFTPIPFEHSVSYDQFLFNTARCNMPVNQWHKPVMGYFWGGKYHHSASSPQKVADRIAEHNAAYAHKPRIIQRCPDTDQILTSLHIASDSNLIPPQKPIPPGDPVKQCPLCSGTGQSLRISGNHLRQLFPNCPACHGTGHIAKDS